MKSKHSTFIFIFISFLSCNQPTAEKIRVPTTVSGSVMNADTIKTPVVTLASGSKRVDLSSANKPAPITATPNVHFTNFNTEQGLVLSSIACSYYDKKGNLWFGTQGGGVSKYDGKSFTNFTSAQGLANNNVKCITEDKSGNIWFGTQGGGVCKYDGKCFTNFTTASGLTNNVILSILEDKAGNLWFGTDGNGVCKYDGRSFINYTNAQGLASNFVWGILQDKKGDLWFATAKGGVSRYNGKSFTNFTSQQGLASNIVVCIAQDHKGNLWFGTEGGGASKYDGKVFTNFTTKNALPNNTVWCITEDRSCHLWFGTDGGGVSEYDGTSFINFTDLQGLANNNVFSISEDRSGSLWFGTGGGGVSKYDGKSFMNFTTAQGLTNNFVLSIAGGTNGDLWFGTDGGGVSKYNGRSFTNFTKAQGLANDFVLSSTKDKSGHLWFGTYKGVSKFDGTSFTNFTDGLENVYALLEDKGGNMWFGLGGGGLCKYDGTSFTNFTTAQGLVDNNIRCITEDKAGRLWIGTRGGGVSMYNGRHFTNFTRTQGLPNNGIFCITEDRIGNIWLGTENGLSQLVMKDGNPSHIKNYGVANGLPDNFVTQVLQLPSGKLLVGTNVGIAVFDASAPLATNGRLAELEVFNGSTGYPIKDVNVGENNMFPDSNGIIWIGTGEEKISLVRFDYSAVSRNIQPPTVVIQSIKLNEEPVCYYTLQAGTDSTTLAQQEIVTYNKILTPPERDSIRKQVNGIKFDGISDFYSLPLNLVLPYNHNNITITYNCVEVNRHFAVNYQYKLEGYDHDWSPILKKQEVSYGNINEGTYTFKLKAQNPDGIWSEPITYTFTVLPPWWRTWWMYIFYGLLVISLLILIVWWNSRKLKARAIELSNEVKKATKEIVEQKQLIEEKHKEITDSINYAERIQRSLLASKQMLDDHLSSSGHAGWDYFVLFKPKDIVSGDFYWASILDNSNFALVTADSTGHGVPGAIMSILNISCLDKAVTKGISGPDLILKETRRLIIEHLKNDGSAGGGKDGMDASVLSFDFKTNQLFCASANHAIWIFRETNSLAGRYDLIEIKADRIPVGKHDRENTPFTLHTVSLQPGDLIYTFTDGYADQFGGTLGKKFKSRQLQQLLSSIAHEPMSVQKQKLIEMFDQWKGTMEQVDDVCLIGIRIGSPG